MSADTARLAATPAPAGKPGGPGLYHVKGMALPAYFEQVRNALIRSGHPPAVAYAITWGAIRRWARGGGKAHPEVVAAAQAALADLAAKSARAHAHANEGGAAVSLSWNGHAIDLATIDLGYLPPHVPAGSPTGGQFGTTAGKGTNSGGTAGKTAAQQHALHLAHIAHLQHLVATGQATPAQKAELAGLLKALKVNPKAAARPGTVAANEAAAAAAIAAHPLPGAVAKKKAAAKPKAPVKAKAAAKPGVTAAKPKAVTPNAPAKPAASTPATALPKAPQARKDALHAQANADRVKAAGIDQQVASLNRVIAAQVKATAAAKAGRKLTPTAAAKATAALAKAAPKKAGNAATKSTGAPRRTLARNRATVKALTGQARALRVQAGALDAQANAIKLSGDDSRRVIDLAGPKGYEHGWVFVGTPGVGAKVFHPVHGHGTVTAHDGSHATVKFDKSGTSKSFESAKGTGKGQLTPREAAAATAPSATRPHHMVTTDASGRVAYHTVHGDSRRDQMLTMAPKNKVAIREEPHGANLSGAPKAAQGFHAHALANGWDASYYPGKSSGSTATDIHTVHAQNPDAGLKTEQSWQGGRKSGYNSVPLAKSIATISGSPRKLATAAPVRDHAHASDNSRFLDLAVADAITVPGLAARRQVLPAERVPAGTPPGGQFAPRPPQFTRHDTPERAAEVINSMSAAQRAQVRATILCPPFHFWTAGDRLAVAE